MNTPPQPIRQRGLPAIQRGNQLHAAFLAAVHSQSDDENAPPGEAHLLEKFSQPEPVCTPAIKRVYHHPSPR